MKKKLDNPTLASDLREGSVFFRRSAIDSETTSPPAANQQALRAQSKARADEKLPQDQPEAITQASSHDTMIERGHGSMTSRYHDRLIDDIRKAVKVVGREPGTIRLTEREKSQLADVVYTLGRQGKRTSENELYRIALNYLLDDYKEHGEESVLSRVITALNA